MSEIGERSADTLRTDAVTSARSWQRVTRAWQIAFCGTLALAAVIAAADHRPWWVYAALVAMAASFTWVLMPAIQSDETGAERLRVLTHLAVVVGGTYAVVLADRNTAFVASVALSQFMPLLRLGLRGIALMGVAALVLTFPMSLAKPFTSGNLSAWLVSAAVTWGVNLFIGSFTSELISGFERRGTLLRQLEEAHAELEAAQHEAGVRAERERLAREIHDTLAQGFTSILMLVQAAEATVESDPAATRQRLALAERAAREGLAEARSLIGGEGVPGAGIGGLPLDDALRRAAERWAAEAGITARVLVSGPARALSANVQVVTLRVAQEALANVRKHARAGAVEVRLVYGDTGMRLTVVDDGVGIAAAGSAVEGGDGGASAGEEGTRSDAASADDAVWTGTGRSADGPASDAGSGGFGLRSMRDRVEQVGGAFAVGAGAGGRGTRISAEVPYG